MSDPFNPRAFPSSAIDDRFGGMSLRDWFAGQALISILSVNIPMSADDPAPSLACAAYLMADAMLAERNRIPTAPPSTEGVEHEVEPTEKGAAGRDTRRPIGADMQEGADGLR